MTTRRELLQGAAALVPLALTPRRGGAGRRATSVVVVGAGAFGGWTALELAKRGANVTLLDAWGAGHTRASSGGETRVIRAAYDGRLEYIEMVRRALDLWHSREREWNRPLLRRAGMLWMYEGDDDGHTRRSAAPMRSRGLTLDEVSLNEAARRWPQIRFEGVRHVWWEPDAGYLLAREACELVRDACVRAGASYVTGHVTSGSIRDGTMGAVNTGSQTYRADLFVFACGPWMPAVFPDIIGRRIRATRQDVLYFGTAPGDTRFDPGSMPIWLNAGERWLYGIPGNERRGFKVADDTLGAEVDPTTFERRLEASSIAVARELLQRRFPALAAAPLVHSEVCQYERSSDGHYLMDWHPVAKNVLLLGGGSGHGFKMGPAIGEMAARMLLERTATVPLFAYGRLTS
jgi:sarcosine oxidase